MCGRKRKVEEGVCVRGVSKAARGGRWVEGRHVRKTRCYCPSTILSQPFTKCRAAPKVNKMGVCCPVAVYVYSVIVKKNRCGEHRKTLCGRTNKCGHTRTARDMSSSVFGGEGCGRDGWRGLMEGDAFVFPPPPPPLTQRKR